MTRVLVIGALLLHSSIESLRAQDHNPLTVQDFDEKVSSYMLENIKAAETKSPRDLSSASNLYRAALRTKVVRREFLSAVRHYHDVVVSHEGFLEKEEAYYAVGLSADALLTELEHLNGAVDRSLVYLDQKHRSIEEELGLYIGQRNAVLHAVLSKPQLLGMKEKEIASLLSKLDETGKHLDAAIDELRSVLLHQYPNQDLAGMPTLP